MRYTGPARPIKTHRIHPVDHTLTRVVFLLCIITVLLLDLFVWRP